MRSKISLALVLAAVAACSACKNNNNDPKPPDTSCTLAALGASCGGDAQCCSNHCANGICVKPVGECAASAAACNAGSDCCLGSCPSGSCCVSPGGTCAETADCCSGDCANHVCLIDNPHPNGSPCTLPSQCQSGYCDPATLKCATPPGPPPCRAQGAACTSASADQCCSTVCDSKTNTCTKPPPICTLVTQECDYDNDCCSHNCAGAIENAATGKHVPGSVCADKCTPDGVTCSAASDCCSGTCNGTCQALGGGTCKIFGENCALPSECCSRNCQGASGSGAADGTCMPVAGCQPTGDICWRNGDCCSDLCTATGGNPGRCRDAPGGCGLEGYPCTTDSSCCTKKCVDLGAGAKACQPTGGCRLNGDYCDSTNACCNLNYLLSRNQWVVCDPKDKVCENGTGCNPPGDICGYKASQDCCYGKKDVCKPDMNGVLRCFGGPATCCDEGGACTRCCPTGWDGNDPNCCIPPGTGPESICQFRDQCCGYLPCVPDGTGVLHCGGSDSCKPRGIICGATSECCTGLTCENIEGRQVCTDVVTTCTVGAGAACVPGSTNPGECCAWGTCDSQTNTCPTSCKAENAQCGATSECCNGLLCTAPPNTSGGTCALCAPFGNSCSANADCCSDACDTTTGTCRLPCLGQGAICTATSECCSKPTQLVCDIPPESTKGQCTPGTGGCSIRGASCSIDSDCCGYLQDGTGDKCTNNVCTAPLPPCDGSGVSCTAGGRPCCTPLSCVDLNASAACTTSSTTCQCATLSACATITNQGGCSLPEADCCVDDTLAIPVCLDNLSGALCTATDLTSCKCHVCPDATNGGDCTNDSNVGPTCCSGFCMLKSNTSISCNSTNPADCKCTPGG